MAVVNMRRTPTPLSPPPLTFSKKLRLVFPAAGMKPRGRDVFREGGELLHLGKGPSLYFALAGKAVTIVQTGKKLANTGNPGADSQVCNWREVQPSSLVEGMR